MRLLVLTNLFPNTVNAGGAFVEERLRAYRSAGVDVTGIALTFDYGRVGSLLAPVPGRQPPRLVPPSLLIPADVPFSPAHRVAIQGTGRAREWTIRHIARHVRPLAGDPPDLVVGHGMYQSSAGRVAREVAAALGVPYSVTLHGTDVNVEMPARRAEFHTTLHGARGCVFVSDALRRTAEDFLGPLPHTLVTGNGFDPAFFFAPPDDEEPAADQPATVLYVGRLVPVKGADRLAQIFQAIAARAPATRFQVVGDGPLEQQVRAGTLGLDVELLGRLGAQDVGAAMRAAQLLVLPSRSEGWPTVIHEAQACGLPVVACDVGGVREALHSPQDLVPEGDGLVDRFAETAARRLASPWPRAVLTASASAHTWTGVARAELDFYTRLLRR